MGDKGERESTVEKNEKNEEVVMDTPDRKKTQVTAPMSKVEDSPVFKFLNSLSPIKSVKSIHVTQTINSLSFASSPSVFTSPHISCLKESRFLRRHQLGDPSKPEFSSDNVNKDDRNEAFEDEALSSTKNQENINPVASAELSIEPSYECPKLAVEPVRILNYDLCSPSSSQRPACGLKSKFMSDMTGSSESLLPYIKEEYHKMFQGVQEMNMEGVSLIDQNKESTGRDWELISDVADLLIFGPPKNTEAFKGSMDPGTKFYASIPNDLENAQDLVAVGSGDQLGDVSELKNLLTQPEVGNEVSEFSETHNIRCISSLGVNCMGGELDDSVDPQAVSNLYRGMRRRCLVFELSGACRRHLHENSTSDSAMLLQSDGHTISSNNQLLPTETGNETSRHVLPGIGLHLNALATASKDCKIVKNEAFAPGKLLITPSLSTNHHLLNTILDSSSKPVNVILSDRETVPVENGTRLLEDSSLVSGYTVNEDYNQNSPKQKRCRLENEEGGTCKRCNCKKSKCLKLYCECFAAGVYCVEPCSCLDCFNKPIHEETVLATRKQIESRNPLAFAPKVIRTSDPLSETGDDSSKTPASARHKSGCNCKKSGCLKKYCECYQGGVGCSINCRCEGCKNAFGRKDGSEVYVEEEEMDTNEKSVMDRSHHSTMIQSDGEQNLEYIPPATPLSFVRPSMQLPLPSKNIPPRSTLLPVVCSSSLYASHGFRKPDFFLPQSKIDNNFGTVQEDEMPEILQTNGSPIRSVKSASPNSKRVSPPHSGRRVPPSQRSSRRLILQSIPSFPSLTPKH